MEVDGQGTVLNLNGYTLGCKTSANFNNVINVVGTANTVMGPGTREYVYAAKHIFLIVYLIIAF